MNPVRIPDDTSSIHNIGKYIMGFQPYQNAFLNALVNRIGRVLVTSRMWENPWAIFKKGRLEYGETVEEIFANIAKPHSYDPGKAESEVFKREIPDVRAAFHTMNFQKFYKVTISNDQLRQAFLSYGELTDLIARIVDTLYTSMNLDEFLVMKYMLCREALNGHIYTVTTKPIEGTGADPTDAIERYREYTNNLKFLKTTYNRAGVRNSTPVADQVIIIPNRAESIMGVQVLAAAFNLSEVDYISRRIPLDSCSFDVDDTLRLAELFENDSEYTPFTEDEIATLEKINAFKLSKGWFMVFVNFEQFTENYNGQGLYWQYFYHVWKTFSVSPFENGIVFTSENGSVTGVTVSPTTANVAQGSSIQMTATVAGTGLYDKSVSWMIDPDNEVASGTNIDGYTGVLHVATDEEVGNTITVYARSKNEDAVGSATITVTAR